MIVVVPVLLREFPCFHDFSHGASHPHLFRFLHLYCISEGSVSIRQCMVSSLTIIVIYIIYTVLSCPGCKIRSVWAAIKILNVHLQYVNIIQPITSNKFILSC